MEFGSILIRFVLVYYIFYIVPLIFNKNKRTIIKKHNNKLDSLRKIKVKTLDQQKEFLNARYPKRQGKFKWSWKKIFKSLPKLILRIFLFILMVKIFGYVLEYFNIHFALWHGILFMIAFPMIANILLEKFGLQKNSMLVFFK